MEGFKNENNEEKGKGVSIVLDEERIGASFWGRNVEVTADELIKIFAIIKHIKEKGFTMSGEVELVASDLLKEFNVKILKYKDVFTNQIIKQILNSSEIDNLSLDFNGDPLTVKTGSTVASMVEDWESKRDSKFNTPEIIEKRAIEDEKRKNVANQEQEILDRMLAELETIDFSNQEQLVDWLYEYHRHYRNDINMYEDEILEKFKAHGYTTKDNDEINGMLGETLKDKKRLGKVIIGYLLVNGALALQRDSWLKNKIEDWKKL